MSLNFILVFSMTAFVASIIPGPSMLLALTHGMHYGAKRTIASAMGNMIVTLIQASISIAGLGTILIASESIFYLIKWAGAAYLIYIGIIFLCSSKALIPSRESYHFNKLHSLKKMFLQSVFVTAGNPKAIVFFTAVFPQFIKSNSAYLIQSCILLGTCALIAFISFMIYAIGGQKIVLLFSNVATGKFVQRLIGGTFIGAGIGLAVSNR